MQLHEVILDKKFLKSENRILSGGKNLIICGLLWKDLLIYLFLTKLSFCPVLHDMF